MIGSIDLEFGWLYVAGDSQILETLYLADFDLERMKNVAQKRIPVRVVLMDEDTVDLDDAQATTTAQVAVWVFLMASSEIQGVYHVAAIESQYWRNHRSCDKGPQER